MIERLRFVKLSGPVSCFEEAAGLCLKADGWEPVYAFGVLRLSPSAKPLGEELPFMEELFYLRDLKARYGKLFFENTAAGRRAENTARKMLSGTEAAGDMSADEAAAFAKETRAVLTPLFSRKEEKKAEIAEQKKAFLRWETQLSGEPVDREAACHVNVLHQEIQKLQEEVFALDVSIAKELSSRGDTLWQAGRILENDLACRRLRPFAVCEPQPFGEAQFLLCGWMRKRAWKRLQRMLTHRDKKSEDVRKIHCEQGLREDIGLDMVQLCMLPVLREETEAVKRKAPILLGGKLVLRRFQSHGL